MNTTLISSTASSTPSAQSNLVTRHPIASVLVIMFTLAWAGLIPEALASQGLIPVQVPRAIEFLVGWTPAIAAILVSGIIGGKKEIGALLRRFLIVRVNVVWYLIALFGMAGVILGGIGLYVLFGGAMPKIPAATVPLTTVAFAFVVTVLLGMIFNTEEIAWRGFILPRLQTKHTALAASLLIAIPEALFHLPYFFNKDIAFYQNVGIPAFAIFTVAMAILYTWMFNNTRGSLLLVTLMHASQNAWANLLSDNQAAPFYWSVALVAIAAVIVVVVFGATNLSRGSKRIRTPDTNS